MSLLRPPRWFAPTALLSLIFAGTPAAQLDPTNPAQLDPPTLTEAAQPSATLATALDAVRSENIRADIFFIASDELEGRYTPSAGLRIAARYIRARLERLGFTPGAADGYFHYYPLLATVVDEEASGVRVETPGGNYAFSSGKDFYHRYPAFWADMTFSGPVLSCGKGSRADFADVDLEGAWALVMDDGEDGGRASREARRAGALGTILVPTANFSGDDYAKRLGPALEQARQGSYRYPTRAEDEGSSRRGMRIHPQLFLTREAGLKLLASAPGRPAGEAGDDWVPPVGTRLNATVTDERRLVPQEAELLVENVCGFWPGSDPVLSKEVIIVSAHYDHVGMQGGEINNGADDNGSGTTGLLAVAEALKHYGPMRRSVLLIWVSGEERGLWGSRAWANSPWLPEGCRPVANLNIDMIGRNAPEELFITPTKDHAQYNFIVEIAQRLCSAEGFEELRSADEFYHRSDQANFATLGIPVAFLFSGLHEDYHKPTDTPEKIDYDKTRRVVRLVVRLLDALQEDRLDPGFELDK